MKVNIMTENSVKKIIEKKIGLEIKSINSYLKKFNERMMRLEDEFKCRRRHKR